MSVFEEFTLKKHKSDLNTVRIYATGELVLPQKAYEWIGSPEYIVFLFNREHQLIGIKPSTASVEHAYPVRKKMKGYQYTCFCKKFLQHYNITISKVTAYDAVLDNGMLVLSKAQQ